MELKISKYVPKYSGPIIDHHSNLSPSLDSSNANRPRTAQINFGLFYLDQVTNSI